MPPAPEPPTRVSPTLRDLVLRLAIVFGIFFAVGEPRQEQLHVMAGGLLERESLDRVEFEALLARTPVTDDGRLLRFRPRGVREKDAAEAV
jgi:hypothetical protein